MQIAPFFFAWKLEWILRGTSAASARQGFGAGEGESGGGFGGGGLRLRAAEGERVGAGQDETLAGIFDAGE